MSGLRTDVACLRSIEADAAQDRKLDTIIDIGRALGASVCRMIDIQASRYHPDNTLEERRAMAAQWLFGGQGV